MRLHTTVCLPFHSVHSAFINVMSAAGLKQRRIISGAEREVILKNVIRMSVTLTEDYTITSCSNTLRGGERQFLLLNNEDNHTQLLLIGR